MKKLLFIFLFIVNFTGFAEAQTSRNPCFINATGGCTPVGTSAPLPTFLSSGTAIIGTVGIDQTTKGTTNGVTVVNTSGTAWDPSQPSQVVGSVAGGSTDSGNPIKIGGIYNSTLPTYTTGQRSDIQTGNHGAVLTAIMAGTNSTNAIASGAQSADGLSASASIGLWINNLNYDFNGSTIDRQFTCPNSAVVNVTAGNTTELVALTSSQIVRVCSIALTSSITGTAQLVYGTGTNCGSGTTNLTGAMALTAGTPLAISAGNGSLIRTIASNALCLAAVTGNITGFISYAKF